MAKKKPPIEEASQKVGCPTKYKPEYSDQARKLCLLGATDSELADFFEVNPDTIYEWKKVHIEFSESIRQAKIIADGSIAEKLYDRAKGATVTIQQAIKLTTKTPDQNGKISQTERIEIVELQQELPPDTPAIIFWLKNRQKEKWSDRHEVKHSGIDDAKRPIVTLPDGTSLEL